MSLWFVISFVKRRNDLADIAWGLGFVMIVLITSFFSYPLNDKATLIAILIVIWGLRLSFHIYLRNKDKSEDYRYEQMKKGWGNNFFLKTYIEVFLLQGIFMLLISLPAVYAIFYRRLFEQNDYVVLLGLLLWIIGFSFEVISDWQLTKFRKTKSKGEILQTGLWKYSRHPNYFGEVLLWWGIYLFANTNTPYSILLLISPILISFLIIKVSGIPLLEKKMNENPAYSPYKEKTSIFIPWPPKK